MKRIIVMIVLMSFFVLPMSASATEPIKLSDDGQYVIMPVEVFRNREIDLLTLEEKVKVLQRALAEERQTYDEWRAQLADLEQAINSERTAWHELEKQIIKENYKWGLIGIVLGAGIGLAVD